MASARSARSLSNVDNLTIITEINGREADSWNTGDLSARRRTAERPERVRHPQSRRCDSDRYAPLPRHAAPGDRVRILAEVSRRWKTRFAEGELA
jgi:5-oxopent-3-ene-1,2,5-tricarboxylate decarboxylase/2-hydroxyhepta-2,4-diene-1,7-dioate isomerase